MLSITRIPALSLIFSGLRLRYPAPVKPFSVNLTGIIAAALIFHGTLSAENHINLIFHDAVSKYFQPVIATEIINSGVPQKIIENYSAKKFRSALVDLHRIIKLNLPDGREDVYLFLLAECEFQLGLIEKAGESYRIINEYHPNSKYTVQSMYRSIEILHETGVIENSSRVFANMRSNFPDHPLTHAAAYIFAKSLIEKKKYAEAMEVLAGIKSRKEYSDPAGFLYALCLLWTDNEEGGINALKTLAENTRKKTISDECYLTLGRVFHKKGKFQEALLYYSKIPSSSSRFILASLKIAMVNLSREKFDEAIAGAKPILKNRDLFFEASLILLDAYWGLKDSTNAAMVRNRLVIQAKLTRLIILTKDEKLFIEQLQRQWQTLADEPLKSEEDREFLVSINNEIQKKLEKMTGKLGEISAKLSGYRLFDEPLSTGGVLEKRLLELYKAELSRLERQIEAAKLQYLQNKDISQPDGDMNFPDGRPDTHRLVLDSLVGRQAELAGIVEELYKLNQTLMKQKTDMSEAQPKFIDVGMILYERLKQRYHNANKNIRIYRNKIDSLLVLQNKEK